ncbi:TatD family hydrolase [Escherichia coli]|uniref:TatD family hydrolase n=1 Tax=Escherichia coli TaxID=562 RepID=UPI003D80A916
MEYRMFDIGVNLTSSQFAKDRDDVVARAFDAGVNGLLITGTNLRESQQAQKLAHQFRSAISPPESTATVPAAPVRVVHRKPNQ